MTDEKVVEKTKKPSTAPKVEKAKPEKETASGSFSLAELTQTARKIRLNILAKD